MTTTQLRAVDPLLHELQHESATTRRVLERLPEDKLDWKPHETSLSLGQLAMHIASLPGMAASFFAEDEFVFPDERQEPGLSSKAEALESHDASLESATAILTSFDDAKMGATWRLMRDGQLLFELPRAFGLRSFLFNHLYHHRGQLAVYYRQLGVPVPSVYGPTADEDPFAV